MGRKKTVKREGYYLVIDEGDRLVYQPITEADLEGKVWKSENKFVDKCSLCDGDYLIKIPREIWRKIRTLLQKMGDDEFIVYLPYQRNGNEFRVEDIIVPQQEVSSASVKPSNPPTGQVGVLHSHGVNSSAFFSSTDEEFLNQNNDFSIVIGGNEIKAKVRVKVPCDKFVKLEAKVEIEEELDESFWDRVKDLIKKERGVVIATSECPYRDNYLQCEYKSYYKCPHYNYECPYPRNWQDAV